jgi:gamma-glutamylaminecyclotransferase
MNHVFVYGTLKRSGFNHRLLWDATYMGDAAVEGYSLTAGGGFPYAVRVEGGQARGEVYEVDDATMDRLDSLEGFPHHYTRDYIGAYIDGVGPVRVWIYVAANDIQDRIFHEGWELVEEWKDGYQSD